MSKQIGARTREKWVDDVKVIACILVVVGHFFQSMVKASILPDSGLYEWFITTVYYFHVPLFFICSGYLYQKYSKRMAFLLIRIHWFPWICGGWRRISRMCWKLVLRSFLRRKCRRILSDSYLYWWTAEAGENLCEGAENEWYLVWHDL